MARERTYRKICLDIVNGDNLGERRNLETTRQREVGAQSRRDGDGSMVGSMVATAFDATIESTLERSGSVDNATRRQRVGKRAEGRSGRRKSLVGLQGIARRDEGVLFQLEASDAAKWFGVADLGRETGGLGDSQARELHHLGRPDRRLVGGEGREPSVGRSFVLVRVASSLGRLGRRLVEGEEVLRLRHDGLPRWGGRFSGG